MRKLTQRVLVVATATALATGAGVLAMADTTASGCTVTYTVGSQWQGGFLGNIAVTNLGAPVSTWKLTWSFDAGQQVKQAWGATVTQSGSTVTAGNASWNGTLATGSTAKMGFVGWQPGTSNPVPGNFTFNGVKCNGEVAPAPTPSSSPSVTSSPSATASATSVPTPSSSPTQTSSASPTQTSVPSSGDGCGRKAGSSPSASVAEVALGSSVASFADQGDTAKQPTALASTPSGESWLAWLGTDSKVHLGKLDCDDKLVGTPTTFAGVDLQDVKADADGGVVLLTRPGSQGSGKLCGGTSSPAYTMWMVRFDNSGKQVWEQQVTNLTSSLGGYDPGARFVWWYNHHGELAFDGTNYAAYFGVAITVANGSCVDIHEGDRMQVVNAATGALVSGHDSFEVGCSHAWDSHITYDASTGHFAMVCATDNDCRIAQPNPYRTVAGGTCDGTLFGGNIVRANGKGYWTAWSNGNQTRLEHFSTGASDKTVTTAAKTQHSHLVAYGSGKMLLTWKSGNAIAAQMYDSATGATVGSQFTITVADHTYVNFEDYTDGSTAYPAAGSSNTTIKIARVMPTT